MTARALVAAAWLVACGRGATSRPPEAPPQASPCAPVKEADASSPIHVTVELLPDRECDGVEGLGCAAGEFCDHPAGDPCTRPGSTGVCRPRPIVCGDFWEPVCGCDGRPYRNACTANSAGTEIAGEGQCVSADGDTHPDRNLASIAALPGSTRAVSAGRCSQGVRSYQRPCRRWRRLPRPREES